MRRQLNLLALASILAGCAAPTPNCDGQDSRPINSPARAEAVYQSCGAAA